MDTVDRAMVGFLVGGIGLIAALGYAASRGAQIDAQCLRHGYPAAKTTISFRTGFRERFSVASLIQTAGRINRDGEAGEFIVFDLLLDEMEGLTAHPAAEKSGEVLKQLLQEGMLERTDLAAAEIVSRAYRDELRAAAEPMRKLARAEKAFDFPSVAKLGRVIDADSGDANVKGAREAFQLLQSDPRIDATALQTVGLKGWDGFAIGVVR